MTSNSFKNPDASQFLFEKSRENYTQLPFKAIKKGLLKHGVEIVESKGSIDKQLKQPYGRLVLTAKPQGKNLERTLVFSWTKRVSGHYEILTYLHP